LGYLCCIPVKLSLTNGQQKVIFWLQKALNSHCPQASRSLYRDEKFIKKEVGDIKPFERSVI